ncbi:hypothetical protein EP7_003705 [Isosphaeraceae bacterium EP7]
MSMTVSGQDVDGDTFTIRLVGPGDLRVVKQNDSTGNPASLSSASLINEITVAGTNPQSSRLVARVNKAPTGDGKVFFANLTQLSSRSLTAGNGNGLQSVDMPNFYLGDTDPATASVQGTPKASIRIPDGVNTFRFGGADTTAFFGTTNSQRLNQNNTSDLFVIALGEPVSGGVRVIANSFVSDAQAAVTTGTTPGSPTQDGIQLVVQGRLNYFQANTIQGNSSLPSGRFSNSGGTLVQSVPDVAGLTGQIGFVKIGGDATNFSVQTNDRISDFFIGGETNNIFLLTPGGSRNLQFGKGMDNVSVLTHNIQTVSANRGATNSSISANREAGLLRFGGDVQGTTVESGVNQDLLSAFNNQSDPTTSNAQSGGGMTVQIAGNVVDSVFAASVEPFNGVFGSANDLNLPHGNVVAKVEGTISNANATPDSPNQAFYANDVNVTRGPVIPPNVAETPFTPTSTVKLPGIGKQVNGQPVIRI